MAQSRTVSSVKMVAPICNATDIRGVATTADFLGYSNGELGRTESGSTDNEKKNLESVKATSDGNGMTVSGVNSLPQLRTVTTTVASAGVVVSSSGGTSSEGNSAMKTEQLPRTIDRVAGQLYTIAEVYLMMMKPSRVPLEYDWVDTSVSNVATDDVSGKLQKLVSIAKAAFTASTAKPRVTFNVNDGNCSNWYWCLRASINLQTPSVSVVWQWITMEQATPLVGVGVLCFPFSALILLID